ncbi:MAG TPA: PepSY-associated TM helix domain-containing protein [Longimicrobium sp.]|nr:PepSY-associated TM helix domain-containing protein [Longimicrobium sp.]
MKRFRTLIFWTHLVTALFVGVVVLVMSVTGVLLTYQRQITAWADTRGLDAGPPSPGARRMGAEALVASVRRTEEGKPTALKWYADPERPAEVAFGREKTVFVSAYTGAVLGEGSAGVRGFFRTVVAWHRWLGGTEGAARDRGKMITGAANLGFLFLVVSGFYLWFPRNWTRAVVRHVIWFRRGLSPRARDFNWHNAIGFWSAVPLFVVVLSGVVISYPWASNLVYRVVGESPPPPAGGPGAGPQAAGGPGARGGEARGGEGRGGSARGGAERGGSEETAPVSLAGIDPLAARAEARVDGWRSITLTLPTKADAPVSFNIDRGDGGQPQKRATLALVRGTGAIDKWEPFAETSKGRQLRSILRFAHTGEVLGLVGQTIAGLVTLGAVVLVWTGIALSLRRFNAWRNRRNGRPPAAKKPAEREEAVAA